MVFKEDNYLLLRDFYNAHSYAVINVQSGILEHVSSSHFEDTEVIVSGMFADIGEHKLALFRHDKMLLKVDDSIIELDEGTSALIEKKKQSHSLLIRTGEQMILELDYHPMVLDPPLDIDPTPFVEEEDFCFALFLYNIINDKARLRRVYNLQNGN